MSSLEVLIYEFASISVSSYCISSRKQINQRRMGEMGREQGEKEATIRLVSSELVRQRGVAPGNTNIDVPCIALRNPAIFFLTITFPFDEITVFALKNASEYVA